MNVQWSHEMSCYVWSCIYGCSGFDFEGQREAEDDFLLHKCGLGS